MAFDVAAARQSGYSDAEIADYLGSQSKFDAGAARQSGYSDTEIIDFLQQPTQPANAPAPPRISAGPSGPPRRYKRTPEEPLLDTLWGSVARGVRGLQEQVPTLRAVNRASALNQINAIDRGESIPPDQLGVFGEQYAAMTPQQRVEARRAFDIEKLPGAIAEDIGTVARLESEKQMFPAPASVQKVMQAPTFGEAVSGFAEHPLKFLTSTGPESLIQSAPGIVAALPAGMAAGPGGAAFAMGAGSFTTDLASSLTGELQQLGINTSDPAALQEALSHRDVLDYLTNKLGSRAAVVGAVDALSAGVASKTLLPKTVLANNPVVRKLAEMAVQTPIQATLGAAGEAGGELAAGEELRPGDILAEAVGEFAQTPAEVAAVQTKGLTDAIQQRARDRQASEDIENRRVAALYGPRPPERGFGAVLAPESPAPTTSPMTERERAHEQLQREGTTNVLELLHSAARREAQPQANARARAADLRAQERADAARSEADRMAAQRAQAAEGRVAERRQLEAQTQAQAQTQEQARARTQQKEEQQQRLSAARQVEQQAREQLARHHPPLPDTIEPPAPTGRPSPGPVGVGLQLLSPAAQEPALQAPTAPTSPPPAAPTADTQVPPAARTPTVPTPPPAPPAGPVSTGAAPAGGTSGLDSIETVVDPDFARGEQDARAGKQITRAQAQQMLSAPGSAQYIRGYMHHHQKSVTPAPQLVHLPDELGSNEQMRREKHALEAGQFETTQDAQGNPVKLVHLRNMRGHGAIVAFTGDNQHAGELHYSTDKSVPYSRFAVPPHDASIETAMRDLAQRTGGFAAAPVKKPKAAARAKQSPSILEYVSGRTLHGAQTRGINFDEAVAHGLDPKELRGARARAFTKGGASLDAWAEHLAEAGYPVKDARGNYDPNVLLDLITRELRQGHRVTAEGRSFEDAEQRAAEQVASLEEQARLLAVEEVGAMAVQNAKADLQPGDLQDPEDIRLIGEALRLDPEQVKFLETLYPNRAGGERDEYMAGIRDIIATDEHQGRTTDEGGQALQPDRGSTDEADTRPQEAGAGETDLLGQPPKPAAAQEVSPRAQQTDLFGGKTQTQQDVADAQRAKDEKRSPDKDVPPGTGGGLFSDQQKQTDIADFKEPTGDEQVTPDEEEVTEQDEDIGAKAAGFEPEASEPEPTSRGAGGATTIRPSTSRENLMDWLGIDPTKFRLIGGAEQFKTAAQAIKDRYGFAQIKKGASQTWRNATDHLLDAFESLQNMAAALDFGTRVASLDGRLSLYFQRNTHARGLFFYRGGPSAGENEISIKNQEDVFAHEYGHALDYHLMEMAGSMGPGGLSRMIRERADTSALPNTIRQAYIDLFNAIFYDQARLAVLIRKVEHQLEQATKKSDIERLQARLDNMLSGEWRGTGAPSDFAARVRRGPMKSYLIKPTEMIARTFEAYISWKIQGAKDAGLVKFLGQPDSVYSDSTNAWMNRIYPQHDERQRIFSAWDNAIGQIRREQVYDPKGNPGYADSHINLGLIDPVAQAKLDGLPITRELAQAKNLSDAAAETYLRDELRRLDTLSRNISELKKGLAEGAPNAANALNAATRALLQTPDAVFAWLEKRFPHLAALRTIRDNLSDAHLHGRDKPIGIYREIQRAENANSNRIEDQLAAVGIHRNMPEEWASHFWDVMHGTAQPRDQAEKIQADVLRHLYDYFWRLRDQSGENIGYTSEPYMNRMFHRDVANSPGFQSDLYRLRVRERERLIELYQERMNDAKTPEEAAKWERKLKDAALINPRKATNAQISAMKGLTWGPILRVGSLSEDSAKERVFGPAADEILKKWYVKDPFTLLASYAHSAARGKVMRERLGANPDQTINGWLASVAPDLPSAFAEILKHSMEASLGLRSDAQSLTSKVVNAYATVSSANALGRAVLPNVSEPFGVFTKSLTPGKTMVDLATAMIPLLRSKDRAARYDAADSFGRVSGILVDAATSSTAHAQAVGDDVQGNKILQRFSTRAYIQNLLSPLTAIQDRVVNRVAMEMFYDAAKSIRANDENADVYRQWLREHGVKDTDGFADYLRDHSVLENFDFEHALGGHGRTLANAGEQFGKTTIQKPTPSTKLLLSRGGSFAAMFRLTGWITTNAANWRNQNFNRLKSAITGEYGSVQLSAKQRAQMMAAPTAQALAFMYVSQAAFVVARMLLTHKDDWDERGKDFWDRFFSRRTQIQIAQYWGVLGIMAQYGSDIFEGVRHGRGFIGSILGPTYGGIAQDAERLVGLAARNSPETNTAEHNAVEATYHQLSMLASLGILSALPVTKAWGRIAGFLWSFFGTSPQMSKFIADQLVGEKNKKDPFQMKGLGNTKKFETPKQLK